jgi:hypothetical protein
MCSSKLSHMGCFGGWAIRGGVKYFNTSFTLLRVFEVCIHWIFYYHIFSRLYISVIVTVILCVLINETNTNQAPFFVLTPLIQISKAAVLNLFLFKQSIQKCTYYLTVINMYFDHKFEIILFSRYFLHLNPANPSLRLETSVFKQLDNLTLTTFLMEEWLMSHQLWE